MTRRRESLTALAASTAVVCVCLLAAAAPQRALARSGAAAGTTLPPIAVRFSGKVTATNPRSGGTLQLTWSEQVTVKQRPGGFGVVSASRIVISGSIEYTQKLGAGSPCKADLTAATPTQAPMQVLTNPEMIEVTATLPVSDADVHSTGDVNGPCSGAFDGVGLFNLLPPASWRNPADQISVTRSMKQPTYSHHYGGSYKATDGSGLRYTVSADLTISPGTSCSGPSATALRCYVALGDSYSAGVMAPFVSGSGGCARSHDAYPEVYDPKVSFWACTGATTATVEQDQLGQLRRTTKLVTLTAGGNDPVTSGGTGLFTQLFYCVVKREGCRTPVDSAKLDVLRANLAELYAKIHARAPLARIFVLGYPNPLPAGTPSTKCAALETNVFKVYHVSLDTKDIPVFQRAVARIDATIRFAVADSRVATYVDTEAAFVGHDVCSGSSYFNPLRPSIEGLHPNQLGQRVLATLLHGAAGPPPT